MPTQSKTNDVYQIITDRIIAKLQDGVIPWRQPWKSSTVPRNLLTGKPYRGVNLLLLASSVHRQPYYLTFNQAKQLGGRVRKGAKSEVVVFWQKRFFNKDTGKWCSLSGDAEVVTNMKIIPMLKYYRVFNISDIEGIDYQEVEENEFDENALLDNLEVGYEPLRKLSGLKLATGYAIAFYQKFKDTVCMPNLEDFDTVTGYFQVLYHEVIHATGHESRLGRPGITDPIKFGTKRYSREELVAEVGSCFLMNRNGLDMSETIENSASYIDGWLRKLQDDKKVFIEAAGQAQKAVDYIYQE